MCEFKIVKVMGSREGEEESEKTIIYINMRASERERARESERASERKQTFGGLQT